MHGNSAKSYTFVAHALPVEYLAQTKLAKAFRINRKNIYTKEIDVKLKEAKENKANYERKHSLAHHIKVSAFSSYCQHVWLLLRRCSRSLTHYLFGFALLHPPIEIPNNICVILV